MSTSYSSYLHHCLSPSFDKDTFNEAYPVHNLMMSRTHYQSLIIEEGTLLFSLGEDPIFLFWRLLGRMSAE